MKRFIYIIALFGILKCYSQETSLDTISNNNQPKLDGIESALLERNITIDTSKIGSYIIFYDIDNHGNGKWVNIYKGYWGEYFGNRYFTDFIKKKEILNWQEWFEKYQKGIVEGEISFLLGNEKIDYVKYEGSLKNNKPNGKWVAFQKNVIVKGNFIDGKPDGEWTYAKKVSLENDTTKEIIYRKEFYRNGIPEGKWRAVYRDYIVEENFVKGKPSGSRNVYVEPDKKKIDINTNGLLYIQSHFTDGYPDGESQIFNLYNPNKKTLALKYLYTMGKPVELILYSKKNDFTNSDFCKTEFSQNSNIILSHFFERGKLINTIQSDKSKDNFEHLLGRFSPDDYSFGLWRTFMLFYIN